MALRLEYSLFKGPDFITCSGLQSSFSLHCANMTPQRPLAGSQSEITRQKTLWGQIHKQGKSRKKVKSLQALMADVATPAMMHTHFVRC